VVQLQAHTDFVWSLAFSPDGQSLVSGSGNHTVRLRDTAPLKARYPARRESAAPRPEAQQLVEARRGSFGRTQRTPGLATRKLGFGRRAAFFLTHLSLVGRMCGQVSLYYRAEIDRGRSPRTRLARPL
jgi:hypothetical protein